MADPLHRKRACIMIVDHDVEYGITLADWLAGNGYQAVLIRSTERAIDECRDLRPQAVFIGFSFSEPVATLSLRRLFRTIKDTSPHGPIITMGTPSSGDQAAILNSGSLRHLHLPIKPREFSYIGRLLRSELNPATASPHTPSTGPKHSAGRDIEHHLLQHTAHQEATAWIA